MKRRKNRLYRWMTLALTVALLAGQGHVSVLAEDANDVPPTELSEETTTDAPDYDDGGEDTNPEDDRESKDGGDSEEDGSTEEDGNKEEEGKDETQEEILPEAVCENDSDGESSIALLSDENLEVYAVGEELIHDGIKYVVTGDAEVEVGEQGEHAVSGGITIPEAFEKDGVTYRVTSIGERAFASCAELTGIEIPESVTSIGERAFEHSRLTSVEIPKGVTSIADYTFYACRSLRSIEIPESVTSIGRSAFNSCWVLSNIKIPEGVTSIGVEAFYNCMAMSSVEIPKGITGLSAAAFYDCRSLRSVVIPENVSSIGYAALGLCDRLASVTITENITEIGASAFWDCGVLTELRIVVSSGRTFRFPEVGEDAFLQIPDERYLLFVDESGQELTGEEFEDVKDAFIEAASADGSSDGKWYGWSLKGVSGVIDSYTVTINVKKDGQPWSGHDRSFALLKNSRFITDLAWVTDGTYRVYDITGIPADSLYGQAEDVGMDVRINGADTGVDVTVNGGNVEAEINYYTVTFYDGKDPYGVGTGQEPQIVLSGKQAVRPADPGKTDCQFAGWKTEDGGDVEFVFSQGIIAPANIYASWIENSEEQERFPIIAWGPGGGDGSGDYNNPGGGSTGNKHSDLADGSSTNDDDITGNMQMIFVSENTPALTENGMSDNTDTAEEIAAGASGQSAGGTEPQTGDASHMEIYATLAMIAGLTYFLLYFMDGVRSMSAHEKDVFVAAFIRWGRKGGLFRKCCALAAIFCLLAYYHAVGKRVEAKVVSGKCMGRAL